MGVLEFQIVSLSFCLRFPDTFLPFQLSILFFREMEEHYFTMATKEGAPNRGRGYVVAREALEEFNVTVYCGKRWKIPERAKEMESPCFVDFLIIKHSSTWRVRTKVGKLWNLYYSTFAFVQPYELPSWSQNLYNTLLGIIIELFVHIKKK